MTKKKEVKQKKVNNPTGRGGFVDHPEHIRWTPKDTVVFWIKKYLKTTRAEFQALDKDRKAGKLTMAQELAYVQVSHARDETDRGFRRLNDVENRTEPKDTIQAPDGTGPAVIIQFPTGEKQ